MMDWVWPYATNTQRWTRNAQHAILGYKTKEDSDKIRRFMLLNNCNLHWVLARLTFEFPIDDDVNDLSQNYDLLLIHSIGF